MEIGNPQGALHATGDARKNTPIIDPAFTRLEIPIRGESVALLLDLNAPSQRFIFDCCQDGLLYEFPAVLALDQVLNPGDTFLDVGAHVGFFALIAARMVSPGGRVIAFEPNSANCQFLQRSVEANGLTNVTLIQAAVGESEGAVTLYENLDNDGGHALWPPGLHPTNSRSRARAASFTVEQTTIDSVVERLSLTHIKAVKIDTEGAEARVILGGSKHLANPTIDLVICEHHRFALQALGGSAADLLRFFYSNGYRGYISSNGVDFVEIAVDATYQPSAIWVEEHRERAENIFFVRPGDFSWPSVFRVVPND